MNIRPFPSAVVTMLLAVGTGFFSVPRAAAQPPAFAQMTFASPEEAIKALRAAAEVHDKAALQKIFGPHLHELLTGDDKHDKVYSQSFAKAMAQGANPVPEGDGRIILEIGGNKWPFPIPLVRENSVWRFDTAAGQEEIINRHIGKDELHAIGVCETYIQAQKRYAAMQNDSSGAARYALKFRSSPGKKDGLYWPNQTPGLLGPQAAEAGVDGGGPAPKTFHGYLFRILTRQGPAAPGGRMDYIKDGGFSGGFALTAYPKSWGKSGIMTFIVNQDGKIYERDLGAETSKRAAAMTEYNPDEGWAPVTDQGVPEK
jgi:hypothetical protein